MKPVPVPLSAGQRMGVRVEFVNGKAVDWIPGPAHPGVQRFAAIIHDSGRWLILWAIIRAGAKPDESLGYAAAMWPSEAIQGVQPIP